MRLINWLAGVLGPNRAPKGNTEIAFAQAKLRARIEANRFSDELQARSDQLWEDLQFRERFFNMRFDEKYKAMEYELRTGQKHDGFFGIRMYPPYTIWHKETAKYLDKAVIEKEWEEYNQKYRAV